MSKSEIIIPSSPADIAEIFKVIKEISNSKTRAAAESEYQKSAMKDLAEKFGIDVKHIRNMANDYFKDQFEERADEFDSYAALYEKIITEGAKLVKPGRPVGSMSDDSEE